MIYFLKRFFVFTIISFFLYSIIYYYSDFHLNKKSASGNIFIWGDSQTYQGLDLNVAQKLTNKKVLSAARHGAGVYDFLVFTERVPGNSTVIIGLSKLALIRPKAYDRSKAGISLNALVDLYNQDYSLRELLFIMRRNLRPVSSYISETQLFDYKEELQITAPISLFETAYSKIPNYLEEKQSLFEMGIRRLFTKKCKVIFVQFPWHKRLYQIEKKSPLKFKIDFFYNNVSSYCGSENTIYIDFIKKKRLMYDLTHLNSKGANYLTKEVFKNINNFTKCKFMIFNPKGLE